MEDETRYTGEAVGTVMETIWTQARHLSLECRTDFSASWTNTQYAFSTRHVHNMICKERGLLTTRKKNILKILPFLEAIWLPRQSAVLHCWAADLVAGQMALRPVGPVDILMSYHNMVQPEPPW